MKTTWRQKALVAACVLGALWVGYEKLWIGLYVPYSENHPLLQLKSSFGEVLSRAKVLKFKPQDGSEITIVLTGRPFSERVKAGFQSSLNLHEHDLFVLAPVTADSNGKNSDGGYDGQIKIEDKQVIYKLTRLPENKSDLHSMSIQIITCDPIEMTGTVKVKTGSERTEEVCSIISMSDAEWSDEQNEREAEHQKMAQIKKSADAFVQFAVAQKAQHDKELADEAAAQVKKQEAVEFARQFRSMFPLGKITKLILQFSNSGIVSDAIKQNGDEIITVRRQTEGAETGGAQYTASYRSGSLDLIDSLTQQSQFILRDNSKDSDKSGWNHMVLNPVTKEFDGAYNYVTDSPGIECNYTVRSDGTQYEHPKISHIDSSSPAKNTDLEEGDFVTSINGHPTEGLPLEQVQTILANASSPIVLETKRERKHVFQYSDWETNRLTFDRETHSQNFVLKANYILPSESTHPLNITTRRIETPKAADTSASIIAKYTTIIGPKNLYNSKRESIIEKMTKNGDPHDDIVKELILQNRADYYRYGIRYQGDEPSPWFVDLGSSDPHQRVNKRDAYEALPITVTPTNWSVRVGTKIDVEITTSEIRAFVH